MQNLTCFLSNARSRFRYGEHSASVRSRFLEEVDASVLRTEAGETFSQKKDRFKLKKGRTVSYDNLDPNYFRQSLTQSKKKRKTVTQTTRVPDGRRVVYDEGEGGQIVPGAIVEHDKFGQGKGPFHGRAGAKC